MCEEGANNDRKGGVEHGSVAAIPCELRTMTAPRVYRSNSYPYDTVGVVSGCQQVLIRSWVGFDSLSMESVGRRKLWFGG